MSNLLADYKQFRAFDADLMAVYGSDLINAQTDEPETVYSGDVAAAIKKFRNGEITQEALLDWVNTVWFTDLFSYTDEQSDSIASVMTELETLDEEGVSYTGAEYDCMIAALESNTDFVK